MKTTTQDGTTLGEIPADGPLLATEQDAVDILALAYGVDRVVIPIARLHPDLLRLRTGLLGAFVQKFANYRQPVAFVGDLTGPLAASEALRAYVAEANRTRAVLFARDPEDLAALLSPP